MAEEQVPGDLIEMTTDAKHNTALMSFFRSERYRWVAVFLIWLAHLIYFFIYSSMGILGPVLK